MSKRGQPNKLGYIAAVGDADKGTIGADGFDKGADWIVFKQKLAEVRMLPEGEWMYLYDSRRTTDRCIRLRRKLIKHYNGFTVFEKPSGLKVSYLQADLAKMIHKPKGKRIIDESEENEEL